MEKTIGFYGAGKMAQAIIKGLLAAKIYAPENVYVYNHRYSDGLKNLVENEGVTPILSAKEVLTKTDLVVMAVSPFVLPQILTEIKDDLTPDTVIVSIAAGVSIADMATIVGERKLIRVMPNTPAMVGAGMSSVSGNEQVTEDEFATVLAIFNSFGKAEIVPERLIGAVIGVSGSAPAYVYMFIEALADGAVLEGMSRKDAYAFAAQTVLGSAKMVLESGKHPGELKDMVCSPGGTTIAAVQALEENHFRASVMAAVQTASRKNSEMSK